MENNATEAKKRENRNRVNLSRAYQSIYQNEIRNQNAEASTSQPKNKTQKPDDKYEGMGAREKLQRWALEYNISKRAISALLKILISLGMSWLPQDSRTLLETPREVQMTQLSNGKLW